MSSLFYRCTGEEDKVLTLHLERSIKIPNCPDDSDLCPLSTIMTLFHKSDDDCNLKNMCSDAGK